MFEIGNVKLKNKVVLAPMAGISNPAYMKIVSEMGCGLAYTELISAEAVVRNNKKTLDMLNGIDLIDMPVGVQLFGSTASVIAEAARILTSLYKVQLIDINMGCPVPKVALRSQAGSALLKDPDKIYDIVSAVVNAVNVPVTVKVRSGWDSNSINVLEVAKKIEAAGASAITVHPRTRAQGYSGTADWNIIKLVKESVKIPVIGNGDITSCYDALKMLNETGCDAVMIGRGALGNPWLIKQCIDYLENGIEPTKISLSEKMTMIKKHVELLKQTKNEKSALLEIRSHAAWYLKGVNNSSKLKVDICKSKSIEELIALLDKFMEEENGSKI